MGKSIFSSKKKADASVDAKAEKKGSLFSKLNQPLFAKKEKNVALDDDNYAESTPQEKRKASLFGKKKQAVKPAKRGHQAYTMFGKPLKGNLLSIDVDSEEIRLVLARNKRLELEILKEAKAPTPDNAVVGTSITDMVALADAIQKLMNEHKMVANYAFFSIDNANTIARNMEVPLVDEADIEGIVSYELQQYLDIDMSSYIVEYQEAAQEIANKIQEEENTMALSVYAVLRGTVDQYVQLAEELKLTPYVFDLRSNVYEKWVEQVTTINNRQVLLTSKNVGIVEMTKDSIQTYLYSKGNFITSNSDTIGYNKLSKLVDTPDMLRDISSVTPGNQDDVKIKEELDVWLTDSAQHILNTEGYFTETTRQKIDTIYVVGKDELYEHLVPLLKNRMGRDVEVINQVECREIAWDLAADFSTDILPAIATLIRRAN